MDGIRPAVAVRREDARPDRLGGHDRRRRVEPHRVRDHDRSARAGEVDLRAVLALTGPAAVPRESDGTCGMLLALRERPDRAAVRVDDRHRQPIGVAQPEAHARDVRRALAHRRERLGHLRRDDRRRNELQPLRDRECSRRADQEAEHEDRGEDARQPAREAIRRSSRAWGERARARPRPARAARPPRGSPAPTAPRRS